MENETQPGGIISPSQPPAGQPPVPPTGSQPIAPITPVASSMPIPTQPLPAFMNAPGTPGATSAPIQSASMQSKSMKNKLKLPLIIVAALLIVGGGSAAAFYGVVVPNKPENKLLSAFSNLASQKNVTMSGNVDYSSTKGGTSVSVDYKLALSTEKTQAGLSGSLGIKGAKFPYELRYIDKDLYLKVSGLNNVASLLPASYTELGFTTSTYDSLFDKINDQWYVIDHTAADELGIKSECVNDISLAFNKADVAILKKSYKEHPLFKVKSSSGETVDGVATTKYIVDPTTDKEAAAFASGLKELSIYKKAKSCAGDSVDSAVKDSSKATNDATGTFAIYVTKDKQLKKIEITSKESSNTTKIGATFSYAPVNLTKPDGAKSLLDLYSDFIGNLNYGPSSDSSSSTGTSSTSQTKADDIERQTDIKALHGQVEAFWAQKGYYPSLADLNNTTFVSANLKGLDKGAFKDPAGTGSTLVGSPQKGAYSYAVTPSSCANTANGQCVSYTLTATLEDGTTFTKNSLN